MLWHSDGDEARSGLVKDINPTCDHSTSVGGRVFFGADDGTHGYGLWTTDGTETGTVMVTDLEPTGDGHEGT